MGSFVLNHRFTLCSRLLGMTQILEPKARAQAARGDLMLPMKHLLLILAAMAIAACAVVSPASASSSGPQIAVAEDCRDAVAVVPGVEERVRRRVPAQFELVRDPLGRPLLFVIASRCVRYTAGSTTGPNTEGYYMAVIKSPDGGGCMSRWPVVGGVKPDLLPLCNFYFLSGAFDNPDAVRAYRERFPGVALRYVRDLALETDKLDLTRLGAPLHFRAGPPTPSPFELDAVTRENPVARPATFAFWTTSSSGIVGARLEFDQLALGQMDATVRAAPESEMAKLLGTETPTPISGFVARYPRTVVTFIPPLSASQRPANRQPAKGDDR